MRGEEVKVLGTPQTTTGSMGLAAIGKKFSSVTAQEGFGKMTFRKL